MTVDTVLTACLKAASALSTLPIRPDGAGADDKVPYVVYQQVGGSRPGTLRGTTNLGNPQFQIDVYAKTKADAVKLAKAVFDAVTNSAPLNAVFLNDGSGREPDTKLYRHRQDFSFWFYD